jgi:hypothetical protein
MNRTMTAEKTKAQKATKSVVSSRKLMIVRDM